MPNPSFRNLGFALLVLSLGLAGELAAASPDTRINSDKPTRGRWDFSPQLLWQVTELEGQALKVPAELRVMADGTLFLRDFPRDLSFVLDADGAFIRAIAPTGEKPGELSHYANCFPTPGQMAICAMDAIHFFDRKGDFIAAFPNNIFASFPGVFLTDREFLSSPGQVFSRASGAMEIRRIQLERGQSEVFTTISTEGAPEPPASNLAITWRGVTPHIEMAFDPERGLVYIGRSDRYAIQVLDLKGKLKQTFGVDRTPLPLTQEAKQAQFGDLALPHGQPTGRDDLLSPHPGRGRPDFCNDDHRHQSPANAGPDRCLFSRWRVLVPCSNHIYGQRTHLRESREPGYPRGFVLRVVGKQRR
jgi:hypothetical protein